MTDAKKQSMLSAMVDESNSGVLSTYLYIAKSKILTHLYPYVENTEDLDLPSKYDALHLEIAAYLINKRGAEGEVSHAENGVSRTYGDADIPANMLRKIVPMCSVLKTNSEASDDEEYE